MCQRKSDTPTWLLTFALLLILITITLELIHQQPKQITCPDTQQNEHLVSIQTNKDTITCVYTEENVHNKRKVYKEGVQQ